MKLPQLLHSTRSYGRASSAFSWKLLVLERGFLSYRLRSPCDRSEKDAWFGYSPVGGSVQRRFPMCGAERKPFGADDFDVADAEEGEDRAQKQPASTTGFR
jgi:hypothetical protein